MNIGCISFKLLQYLSDVINDKVNKEMININIQVSFSNATVKHFCKN